MTPTEQHNTNPFFSKHYGTPFDTAPFDRIRLEHYEPAFMEGIRQDEAFINSIVNLFKTYTAALPTSVVAVILLIVGLKIGKSLLKIIAVALIVAAILFFVLKV